MSNVIAATASLSTSIFDTESPGEDIYSLVGVNDIAADIMDRVMRDGFCTVVRLGKFFDPASPDSSINLWAIDGRRVAATSSESIWEDLDTIRFADMLEQCGGK